MQQFVDDPRFLLLRGLKQGMYADWNECLRHVDTEYFYILTSDDTCYPGLISNTVNALDQFKDVQACHFKYALIDRGGAIVNTPEDCIKERYPIYSEANLYPHRRSGICESILHYAYGTIYTTLTSLVLRKSLLSKIGEFPSNYGSVGDYDWTMKIGFFTDVIYLPILLATWRIYPEQATAQGDGIQSVESYYKISQKNLDAIQERCKKRPHKKNMEGDYIISYMRDNYIRAGLHFFTRSGNLRQNLFSLFQLIRLSPSYLIRKFLRRVSANQIYTYDKAKFAYGLIAKYDLAWPPQSIILESTRQKSLCE